MNVSGSLHNPLSQFLRLNFFRIRERNRYRPRRFCLENPNTDFRKEKDVSCTILQVSLGRSSYLNTTLSPETPTYLKQTRLYYDLSLSFLCFMHCVANVSLKLYKILLFAQLQFQSETTPQPSEQGSTCNPQTRRALTTNPKHQKGITTTLPTESWRHWSK